MNCFCGKKLRKDNKIGVCRKHRAQSPNRKSYMKEYTTENKTQISSYKKEWSVKNRKKLAIQQSIRYRTNPHYKLGMSLRNRMNKALKGFKKPGSPIKDLGCTVEFLKQYLESKFQPGMSWENHSSSGWHIDHIIPLCTFDLTDQEQFKKACHYTNLQPLWAVDNLTKPKRI